MNYFSQGPFGMTLLRSQEVDFSLPIITDEMTGFLAFGVSKDLGILFRAFDWRVWLSVIIITPVYIAMVGLSNWFYGSHVSWYGYLEFCIRTICMDNVKVPQTQTYNKVYSIIWIWMSFVLFLAYEGKRLIKIWCSTNIMYTLLQLH